MPSRRETGAAKDDARRWREDRAEDAGKDKLRAGILASSYLRDLGELLDDAVCVNAPDGKRGGGS